MSGEKKFILGIVAVSIAILVLLAFTTSRNNNSTPTTSLTDDGNEALSSNPESQENTGLIGEQQPYEGAAHVARGTIPMRQDPPTSGDHYGDGVAGGGIHDEPVEDGLMVHSLEHGAVVLHYDPDQLSEEQINQLKDVFTNKFAGKKIMMPRPGMSAPIIMTAWNWSLKLDEIDEEKMVEFMTTHNDNGPEKVPMF